MANICYVCYQFFNEILWLLFASNWGWEKEVIVPHIFLTFILYTQPDLRISSEVSKLFCGSFQDSVEFLANEVVL